VGRPFIKELTLTRNGVDYYFKFEIVYQYLRRAYDDGSSFEGDGYAIYILNAPYYDWCLDNNRTHEFHFYSPAGEAPSICWNRNITDFSSANAVMLVWAKHYVDTLEEAFGNSSRSIRTVDLPSGTFRKASLKKS
jgi:hypothetical protein